jgi:hypothetical protein
MDLEVVGRVEAVAAHLLVEQVVVEGLAGPVAMVRDAEASGADDGDGRQQVALEAHGGTAVRLRARRLDDGAADRGGAHVGRARGVAALAARPLREDLGEALLAPVHVAGTGHLGTGVVTEHALALHLALQTRVIRSLEARRHLPDAVLAVPADRQHEEFAGVVAVEIAARAVAGAEDPGDGQLALGDARTGGVELPATEGEALAVPDDLVVAVRGDVVEHLREGFDTLGVRGATDLLTSEGGHGIEGLGLRPEGCGREEEARQQEGRQREARAY